MKEERRERFKKEGIKRKRDEMAAESRGRKKRALVVGYTFFPMYHFCVQSSYHPPVS